MHGCNYSLDILERTPHQGRVDEFMRLAKQALPEEPTMPSEEVRRLRANLILEEAVETIEALGFEVEASGGGVLVLFPHDRPIALEAIADGCADTIVVTTGTLSACGIADNAVQVEVDCNNLAKFEHRCPECGKLHDEAKMTEAEKVVHLMPGRKFGKPGHRECLSCKHVWQSGHHNASGKWVKPANHKPPRIAEVLAEQTTVAQARRAY